jgi:dTMP kinase
MLISIEGTDGAGKNTQAKLLAERISKERAPIHGQLFSFPVYDGIMGRMVKRYLKGAMGTVYANNPLLVSTLYALDRFEAKRALQLAKERGNIIVCDRYVHSNVAHQAGKLWDDPAWEQLADDIERVEFEVLGLPEPELIFYLDLTAEQSYARTHSRDSTTDIHQSNIEYLDKVRQVYLHYANFYQPWHLIACFADGKPRSVEEIHNEIWSIFSQHAQQ